MRISLNEASHILCTGGVVAVPTETVYGLAAALNQPEAIERVFKLKGRPANNPLIIHVPNEAAIQPYLTTIPNQFQLLANHFWPGPLTLVLPIDKSKIPEKARAGLPTAAFRVPSHALTRELLEQTGPLVMPSANLSGKPSATQPEHVESDFGDCFPVLDGGRCKHGLESTILYFNEKDWQIVRLGSISAEEFIPILGYAPEVVCSSKDKAPICPGQLYRHYAPKAKLILCENPDNCTEVVLGFNDRLYSKAERTIILGSTNNPEEVAENLYAKLRQLDEENVLSAHVDINFPQEGLWVTILERIQKAAS